jgi:beta-mannosidase
MPSVKRMIKNPEVASATSYELTTHTKARIGNYLQIKYLEKYFPKWQTFEQYIAFSGLLQGMALEYAINHWRTTWPRCGGTLIWQLNDSWPAGSWSFIDYYQRPKTAYYFVQRIYRPVTIQVVENTLFVSNDLNEILDEKLNCRVYRLDGTLQEEKSYLITVPAHQVRSIVQLFDAAKLPGSVVDCSIDATSFQTHATTMIGWPKQWTIPIKPEYDISYDGELLTISTSGVIPFLMIDAEQSQENYLTIVPQKTYRIKVRGLRKLYDIFRNTDLHFRS